MPPPQSFVCSIILSQNPTSSAKEETKFPLPRKIAGSPRRLSDGVAQPASSRLALAPVESAEAVGLGVLPNAECKYH
eukprot:SAG31_NODE_4388_length_3277_cov_9.846564_2_plen_77_part_00